jgi:hypothetical protein
VITGIYLLEQESNNLQRGESSAETVREKGKKRLKETREQTENRLNYQKNVIAKRESE